MSNRVFHIMSLTKNQQATLRLMMFDLLAKHIRMVMDRTVGVDGTQENSDVGYKSIVSAVDLYERIVQILPTLSTLPNHKDTIMQLDTKSMQYVVKGVNFYDRENSALAPEEHTFMTPHAPGLKKLVNESSQFTYTDDDVRRARGGK